ncbi:MAG: signal recognition particle receptor subunit alpha, partial [Deltaproteobacteria bacterium]|nr:signal recognition particle receptor subunit alpha [Deltaproteobacteria bacterium]
MDEIVISLVLFLCLGFVFFFLKKNKKKRGETKKSLQTALFKTNSAWHPFKNFFSKKNLSQEDLESIEELLITSDVGIATSHKILEKLKNKLSRNDDIKENLKNSLEEIMGQVNHRFSDIKESCIFLIIGVNGVGKTTTIAKLTQYLLNLQKKTFLVAGDTFRAAAIEQLESWAQRLEVPLF